MNDYPANWPDIARAVKDAAGWRCLCCGHPHETPTRRVRCDDGCNVKRHGGQLNDGRQRVLTVHHANGNKADCRPQNLLALCQVCHLSVQAWFNPQQLPLLPLPTWLARATKMTKTRGEQSQSLRQEAHML